MLITDYAIVKLYRNELRQWIVLGQTNELPGGVRPIEIWPIVGIIDQETDEIKPLPRTRADGYIDAKEQYAYVYWKFLKRLYAEELTAVDGVTVELNGVRLS